MWKLILNLFPSFFFHLEIILNSISFQFNFDLNFFCVWFGLVAFPASTFRSTPLLLLILFYSCCFLLTFLFNFIVIFPVNRTEWINVNKVPNYFRFFLHPPEILIISQLFPIDVFSRFPSQSSEKFDGKYLDWMEFNALPSDYEALFLSLWPLSCGFRAV